MQAHYSLNWLYGLFLFFLCCTAAQAQNQPTGYAPDRVLIAFEQGTLGAEKKALHAKLGASVLHTIHALGVDVVQVPAGTVLEKIKLYDKNPNVRYAEPDHYRLTGFPAEGVEPFATNMFDQQWALHNTGQFISTGICLPEELGGCIPAIVGTPDADIDAPEAWDIAESTSDIKIAILDSGVDGTSLDLKNKYLGGVNFVDSYQDPSDITLEDRIGHGTHVAGIAAAECNNGQGVAGVACLASVVSLKVCYRYQNPTDPFDPLNGVGVCPASAVAAAILHAANPDGDDNTDDHFNVVNMSFGTDKLLVGGEYDGLLGKSITEENAINIAFDAGVILVAAAGNDGSSNQFYPAGYDNVIAVGATDEDDRVPAFSNRGPDWVSVGAPGNHIWSTMPNIMCGLSSTPDEVCLTPNTGTSMASPHVAGAAAVVLGYLRNEYAAHNLDNPPTNAQVRCHIEQGADKSSVEGLDYSVVYFQYGRLNLAGALQYIAACDGSSSGETAAPSGLTAENSYAGRGKNKTFTGVFLSWTNNAINAQSYLVQRCNNVSVSGPKRQRVYTCPSNDDWQTLSDNVPVNETTYIDGINLILTNETYLYRVQANSAAGSSPWSNEAGVTTPKN
ncbi:MAG: S8 family serine peptidase [Nitrosomonas sp.]|nr:S8 family serine peptidase [Nitrosomonas sp.]